MCRNIERCKECIYECEGECNKGFEVFSGDCYFESKYIYDDETGEIIYSEEFEEEDI